MGRANASSIPRRAADDSDAYVRIDPRARVLDVADDGSVDRLLPRPSAIDRLPRLLVTAAVPRKKPAHS